MVERHWRLVAILEVVETFLNHSDAAEWYRQNGEPLPSNCMVHGNPPMPLEMTDRFHSDLKHWDAIYRLRAMSCGIFHVCKSLHTDLENPPPITEKMMREIFGTIPATRNPPSINATAFDKLVRIALRAVK